MAMRNHLEPGALNPDYPKSEEVANYAWQDEVQASIAISLKRIADILEKAHTPIIVERKQCPHGEDPYDCLACTPF